MESNNLFGGKKILLGVSGSIAAYKSASLCAKLVRLGAEVYPAMTKNAAYFLNPITLSTISANKTIVDMFENSEKIYHVSLAQSVDLMLIAPASANIISKSACGICDDFLSTAIISTNAPVLFAPAMNEAMYLNAAVQENIGRLKQRGNYFFAGPSKGYLACKKEGIGRMVEEDVLLEEASNLIRFKDDLHGKNVLVTAGGTKEAIDAVRYISNYSSGKMGAALAEEAFFRGAEKVTLISANKEMLSPYGVETIYAPSTSDMKRVLSEKFEDADIMIMAAAVSDIVSDQKYDHKLKKEDGFIDSLRFKENENLLAYLSAVKKKGQVLVGFAAESTDVLDNAKKKIEGKNIDMIVANDISRADIAFDSAYNEVYILMKNKEIMKIARNKKRMIARHIFDNILKIIN
jgi:phosphopantothenoylcysteine decarboxylase / phosphopantothenate---cysteine ligase